MVSRARALVASAGVAGVAVVCVLAAGSRTPETPGGGAGGSAPGPDAPGATQLAHRAMAARTGPAAAAGESLAGTPRSTLDFGATGLPAAVQEANIPYDGRFTFVRIRTDVSGGLGSSRGGFSGRGRRGRGQPGWAHDYPRAERNFAKILTATTFVNTYEGGSNILTFADPELMRYPLAYVSEPGSWDMDEAEEEGLRNYLLKGGFVIFDDFGGRDWFHFEAQMLRVLPESVFHDLSDLDPLPTVFDSFFEISNPEALAPPYRGGWPQYLGIFEDNDPAKRLMVVANYNNDLGDYWEFSDSGWLPIDLTNEAYKFGVNYVIYAMTH